MLGLWLLLVCCWGVIGLCVVYLYGSMVLDGGLL